MPIGLFIVTAIPTVTGVAQAISAQKNREKRQKDEERMKKFNVDVQFNDDCLKAGVTQNGRVVVKDQRVWIGPPGLNQEGEYGFVSECIIVEYPDAERVPIPFGLVSQVQSNPPLLNWIYVDGDTMEMRYGNKTASIAHHVGSWDWTEDGEFLTLEDENGKQRENFVAVKTTSSKIWQLFCDLNADGLEGYESDNCIKLPVRLKRILVPET